MIRIDNADGIATVTIDRPDRRNSLTLSMWWEMAEHFQRLENDPAVRGVILTGAGGGFSAGADISEFGETRSGVEASLAYEEAYEAACAAIAATGKPVIAAIEGYCFGGACQLAMACDFRVAAPDARFGIPAAKLSIVYSPSGVARLLALVGLQEARQILYSGEPFEAERALKSGFVDEVAADPRAAAQARLKGLSASAPLSIRGVKAILNSLTLPHQPFDDARTRDAILLAMQSQDYAEARTAFTEKRKPRFKGV